MIRDKYVLRAGLQMMQAGQPHACGGRAQDKPRAEDAQPVRRASLVDIGDQGADRRHHDREGRAHDRRAEPPQSIKNPLRYRGAKPARPRIRVFADFTHPLMALRAPGLPVYWRETRSGSAARTKGSPGNRFSIAFVLS